MIKVILFGEDYAHEVVIRTVLERIAADHETVAEIHVRSAIGGHGRMMQELRDYIQELRRNNKTLPDLFVAGRDANCLGYAERVKEITNDVGYYEGLMVLAVPDPHVERWLLLDSHAFKQVLGKGCQAPDAKCDRDRYKQLLAEAIKSAGVDPTLGGVEYAEEIIRAMNMDRAGRADTSFAHLLRDLRAAFHRLQRK